MSEREGKTGAQTLEFVSFEMGGERFGLEIGSVREVALLPEVTPVPSMPGWLVGVVNLRGEVVPVVDLRNALGAPEGRTGGDRMIVVEIESRPVGIVVAGVPRIERADPSAVVPAPELVASRLKRDFVKGVVKQGEDLVILLDMSAIISAEELGAATVE
ncbi:MAG TPA: chemotaxis protein CheW [bacterium]|nr:chemotaxis protein CheW [bacterium]